MSATQAYALFPTAIGHCGIAWGAQGLTGAQLPEQDEAATRARMARRFPSCGEADAPPVVQEAMDAIVALLNGTPTESADLRHVVLDMTIVPPFHQRVYALARAIAPGDTATYGELARQLGDPGARVAFLPMVACRPSCGCG